MAEMISTILKARRIFSFTGKTKLIRNTRPVIIPVDAINDIIKTIRDFPGSNRYAHGRMIPPETRVALIPIIAAIEHDTDLFFDIFIQFLLV